MFTGKIPLNLEGLHAYSHVNSLSGAAMTYAVTGDSEYLKTIINAYDYFQETQCYATGGYGPSELLAADDGILGKSIEAESKAFYGHWPEKHTKGRYMTKRTRSAFLALSVLFACSSAFAQEMQEPLRPQFH